MGRTQNKHKTVAEKARKLIAKLQIYSEGKADKVSQVYYFQNYDFAQEKVQTDFANEI